MQFNVFQELQVGLAYQKKQNVMQPKFSKWHKSMKKARRSIEKDSSRLDAKYKMGDMSASTYDDAKARIERSLMVLEVAREMLDEIIENAKKM